MILVTGGTGLVGAHLLYHLVQEHSKVRATHRKQSNLEAVKQVFSYYTETPETHFHKIEWVEVNITRIPELTEAFEGITHVYHCAAFVSFNPKHFQALKKANVEGTANVVNLCIAKGIQKLCYVSSVATLGMPENSPFISEETPWNPEDQNSVYSITKYGAEMEVWRGSQEGLNVVIVNPGVILGEGFWHSSSGVIIKRAARGIRHYTSGSSGFVDVRDVVTIMIQFMNSSITQERFVVVAENLSYQKLLTLLAKAFGNPPPTKKISKRVLLFLSSTDWFFSKFFGRKRSLLKATVRSLFTHSSYDASKIKETLSVDFIPMEKTMDRIAKAYKNHS
ncbi:MAG: NAD-dependent epimerase [Alteromonas sp.]|nr:NAD-dependent epimerase [Alteromonas sp.]MAY22582.1 NAD-dependent epimerase [Flavobacteriaceae bacterium]|tara:strand:+ start:27291 stop:28298 length:1008 start_codon:yes stop_codon:yes gene_type:complete